MVVFIYYILLIGMSPVSSTSLWPVLFAPLAVILLVLVIVVAGGIVYCKRRKPEASKELPGDTKTEKVYEGWFCSLAIRRLHNLSIQM